MGTSIIFLLVVIVLVSFFPEALLSIIRSLKRRLKDDIRKRVSDEDWKRIQDSFPDGG